MLAVEIAAAGGEAIALELDVADEASTIAAFDAAEAAFGPVTSIIANAGVNSEVSAVDLPVETFDDLFAVNVRGVFLTLREGARRLMADRSPERPEGRFVIISSVTAQAVSAGLAPYSASKAAVLQMGKVLARDWIRKRINVNMMLPGYIRTEINAEWFNGEAGARQIAAFPRRRLVEPGELDAMALYLASDASAGVTGAAFTIDDGQTL